MYLVALQYGQMHQNWFCRTYVNKYLSHDHGLSGLVFMQLHQNLFFIPQDVAKCLWLPGSMQKCIRTCF
jgi:hypothetical protein